MTSSIKYPMDASTLNFAAYGVVNAILLVLAIIYWTLVTIDWYVFWVGVVSSAINSVGIVCI